MNNDMNEITEHANGLLPNGYTLWRKDIETLIDTAKLKTAINVNMGTLSLYWSIGKPILQVPLAKLENEGTEFVQVSLAQIGLLLCRSKSNKKAEFSLRGITQPMGIAQYETEKLFADVASALPCIEELEKSMDDLEKNE